MYILKSHIKKILPVIFLVSMLFTLPSCRYIRQRLDLGEYSLKYTIEWAKKDSARVADSLKMIIEEKKVVERTLTDSLMKLSDNILAGGDTGPGYYIICGSFTSHDNAKQAADRYKNEGFKTAIISTYGSNGSRLELVSVKTFTDYHEAQTFLRGFKGIYDPAAWIYTVKVTLKGIR
jgi:hypothetical protein